MYEAREPEEDTGVIQTFKVKDADADIDIENPDVVNEREFTGDFTASEVMAMENMWLNAAQDYSKAQKEQKNYPRIDVMIEKNCLISYTGHMVDFPAEEFQSIIDKVIMARIDIEGLINDRVKNMPKEQFEQSGYQ